MFDFVSRWGDVRSDRNLVSVPLWYVQVRTPMSETPRSSCVSEFNQTGYVSVVINIVIRLQKTPQIPTNKRTKTNTKTNKHSPKKQTKATHKKQKTHKTPQKKTHIQNKTTNFGVGSFSNFGYGIVDLYKAADYFETWHFSKQCVLCDIC